MSPNDRPGMLMPDAAIIIAMISVFFLVMLGISFKLLGDFLEKMDRIEKLGQSNKTSFIREANQ